MFLCQKCKLVGFGGSTSIYSTAYKKTAPSPLDKFPDNKILRHTNDESLNQSERSTENSRQGDSIVSENC